MEAQSYLLGFSLLANVILGVIVALKEESNASNNNMARGCLGTLLIGSALVLGIWLLVLTGYINI